MKRHPSRLAALTAVFLLLLTVSACTPQETDPAVEVDALPTEAEIAQLPTDPPPTETQTPSPQPTVGPPATLTPKPTSTATNTPEASPTNTATPTETATPTATTTPTLPPPPPVAPLPDFNLVPGEPQSYLGQVRVVSYYGTPQGPSLGILGAQPRYLTNGMLRRLASEFVPYSDKPVIPAYHMITTVADAWPGQDGNYNHWLDWGIILDWIEVGKENGVATIIDLQPGREDVMVEFERIWGLLYEPHVMLALDPEFIMYPDETPGQQLGQISAEQINAVQARMNAIGYEIGLNRVLIIHQFEDEMILNKEQIQNFPFVELVIDADGFGPAGTKIRDYQQYAVEPGFEYGGFKVFYDWDSPVMTPDQIMTALSPAPSIIIFQ